MNKKILIPIIVFLLLAVGLSGCNTTSDTGWAGKVEIVMWYTGTYWEAGKLMANGFVYNESVKFYLVNGTARNIADEGIKNVIIYVKYYDINNSLLWEDGVLANDIARNQTWEFYSFYLSDMDHFKEVNHVEFNGTVTLVD